MDNRDLRGHCEDCGRRRVMVWTDSEGVGLCRPCYGLYTEPPGGPDTEEN